MRRRFLLFAALCGALATQTACTTYEQVPGSSGVVIDTYGVDMRQYQADLAQCQSYATVVRRDEGRRGVTGAAGGALLGGALGAIVGDSSSAAAAGAGAGALLGGISGATSAHGEAGYMLRNCLRGRGYRVLN